MRLFNTLPWLACALAAGAAAAGPALAQEAAEAEVVAEVVSNINAGDTAWMLTSSLLVLFMILPGLALFYGGLVRAKNMLSVLMQCTTITAVVMIIYVLYGYTVSFGGSESAFWGGLGKSFLAGVTPNSESGTIPELLFVAFQMTFACITPALIVGGFAERMKFSAVILFVILWVTLVYFPIAHMAWDVNGLYFSGARRILRAAPWCISTPASRRWWGRCSSGRASATARRSCRRTP